MIGREVQRQLKYIYMNLFSRSSPLFFYLLLIERLIGYIFSQLLNLIDQSKKNFVFV